MGGRSRVAAQALSGMGYEQVYNVSGGIKAWEGHVAVGTPELGLNLFDVVDSWEGLFKAAYSLEDGLQVFYESMEARATMDGVRRLFKKLAAIESGHKRLLYNAHGKLLESPMPLPDASDSGIEGGLPLGEYEQMFTGDMESEVAIVSMAMAVEAQAQDLYLRLAAQIQEVTIQTLVQQLADEEREHLNLLGRLMDRIHSGKGEGS